MVFSAVTDYKRFKAVKTEVEKAANEVEKKIGKKYEEVLVENERLKKLCDRTLAAAENMEAELVQLRDAKSKLKKENRELREELLEKESKSTKIKVK